MNPFLGPLTISSSTMEKEKLRLECPKENDSVLIGIISWGFPDMDHRNATVYVTRVDAMMPWIENKISTIRRSRYNYNSYAEG